MPKRSVNRPHAGTPLGPLLLLMALLAGLTAAAPPAGVMALFGLLPTAVAFLVDWRDDRSAAYAVGGMNLAGLLPVVVPMLGQGQLPATGAFSQIVSLIIAYASAAFGWTLVVVLPTVAEAIDRALTMRARNTVHEAQRRLVEAWGSDVRGPLPPPPAGLAGRPHVRHPHVR